MARPERLNPTEDQFWRAQMQIVLLLPRRLDGHLMETVGINSNEYVTLMSLSEAPRGQLRMRDLARSTALSASRMTRLVEELQSRGLAKKQASNEDGRGNVASLTPAGLEMLEAAWQVHVSSVRALVFDHVDRAIANAAALALAEVAAGLER
jgi:DNA-binding MarR family transcriptional regulator